MAQLPQPRVIPVAHIFVPRGKSSRQWLDLKTQNYALSIAATTAHGLFSNPFSVMPPTSAARAHRAATPHSGPADARRGAQVRNPRFQLPADRIATPLQCWLDQ